MWSFITAVKLKLSAIANTAQPNDLHWQPFVLLSNVALLLCKRGTHVLAIVRRPEKKEPRNS